MLHLTNGDCAVPSLRAAGVEDEVVSWADVLHNGPVPGDPSHAELRAVRARFLGVPEDDLRARDERLEVATAVGEEVVLWFEADLFDMLNVLQILDRVPVAAHADARLVLARHAWAAFTAPTPLAMEALAVGGTPALPAVGLALRRLLEELPWVGDDLGRTERQLRSALAEGATRVDAFLAAVRMEERPFLGDASAWAVLDHEPNASRWIGGTEIAPGPSPWLWDPAAEPVVAR